MFKDLIAELLVRRRHHVQLRQTRAAAASFFAAILLDLPLPHQQATGTPQRFHRHLVPLPQQVARCRDAFGVKNKVATVELRRCWSYLTKTCRFLGRCPCPYQTLQRKHPRRNRDDQGSSQERQGTRTGQPEQPTGTETKRRPGRADPTCLPRELERDARGRQGTTQPEQHNLSVFESAGSWVGALCLLLGSRVGARVQCTEPSRLLRRHLRALTLPPFEAFLRPRRHGVTTLAYDSSNKRRDRRHNHRVTSVTTRVRDTVNEHRG